VQVTGELERAEGLIDSALTLDANNVKVHIARAQLEMRRGNTTKATTILQEASG
jgi:lipopolysaccharide biosynthesis regulator YciM